MNNVNEISLLEKDLKNMEKRLNKKKFNILKSAARSTIREDLLLNKRLIYCRFVEFKIFVHFF